MHFSILDTLNCQVSILHSEGRKNENLRILLIFRMLGLYMEVQTRASQDIILLVIFWVFQVLKAYFKLLP